MAAAAKKIEKGELLSITEIGRRVKLHRKTAADRLDDLGYEPDPTSTANNKLYLFDDEMKFAILSSKDQSSAMKIRDLRATAELKELKLAEARSELVPMADVVSDLQKLFTSFVQEFTVRQGKRIDAKLAKAKTAVEAKKIRNGDNIRILKVLRENYGRFIE